MKELQVIDQPVCQPADPRDYRIHHEPNRVSVQGILLSMGLVLACVGLCLGAIALLTAHWGKAQHFNVTGRHIQPPLPVHVQSWIEPGTELDSVKKTWHDHLETYGWVNRQAGVVRIPIERSMELLVEQQAQKPDASQAFSPQEVQ